jgi:hypothetical protein
MAVIVIKIKETVASFAKCANFAGREKTIITIFHIPN